MNDTKKKFIETGLGKFLTNIVGNPAEGAVNSVLSLVRDKVRDPDTSFIREKVKKGVSLSQKRILNWSATGGILGTAVYLIAKDGIITNQHLILVGIGAAYSLALAYITAWKEK